MKKKIFYWSPCIANVGTVKSTINSAIALSKYNNLNYKISIINVCGEWDVHKKFFYDNNIDLIKLNFSYFNFLPKSGFLKSRFSYIIIFLFSFFPLLKLLNRQKPDFLVLHLITSLPLILNFLLRPKIKLILRISGFPRLNKFRKLFWKIVTKKIYKITCPSVELKNNLIKQKFLENEKIFFLPDAIINIDKFINLKYKKIEKKSSKKFILSVGRFTLQKNFKYLINEVSEFFKINNEFDLYIIGEGEQKNELKKLINEKKLNNRIFLINYTNNVYSYMKNASLYVLSSLWEDPGFVIIEAALCNLSIISSNCSNGPKEFLMNGEAGILYSSNKKGHLEKALINFSRNDFKKRVKAKKNCMIYTNFRHYKKFQSILSDY